MTTIVDITDLIRSTLELHERFDVDFDVEVAERLCAEEFRELIRASVLNDAEGFSGREVAEEFVDLIVVGVGLLQAHGALELLQAAISRTIDKNDAKTDDTHILLNGKITRRSQPKPADDEWVPEVGDIVFVDDPLAFFVHEEGQIIHVVNDDEIHVNHGRDNPDRYYAKSSLVLVKKAGR